MKRFCLMVCLVLTFGMAYGSPVAGGESHSIAVSSGDTTQLTVYVEGTVLRTMDVPDGSVLNIYSITGQRLGTYTVIDNYVELNNALPKGIYIVRVNGRSAKITIKN